MAEYYLCKYYKHEKVIRCPVDGAGGWCTPDNLCELTTNKNFALYPLPVAFKYETYDFSETDAETGERTFWFGDVCGIKCVEESELVKWEDTNATT